MSLWQQLCDDSRQALPVLMWAISGIALLISQIILRSQKVAWLLTVAGLCSVMAVTWASFPVETAPSLFWGSVVLDPMALAINFLIALMTLGVVALSVPGKNGPKFFVQAFDQLPEFLMCILFSGFGASVLISAQDLTAFFLGLETLSIALYCLCGFYRTEIRSTESALKYLIMGAFSTALLLYGLSWLYGATGATGYATMAMAVPAASKVLLSLATVFLVAAFGFKMTLVPFHFYAPEVYEGAPTPVTAYLATVVKGAVVIGFLRLFWTVMGAVSSYWIPFVMALAVLSIVIGNLSALRQSSLKKLLALSGVSHAGFLALGLVVSDPQKGDLFPLVSYFFVYGLMSLGSFALITLMENKSISTSVEDLKGLSSRSFSLSFLIAIFILGLAGIPPLAGFMIKFWVLRSMVEQGYIFATLGAVIGSVIGAGYYLRLLVLIFMKDADESSSIASNYQFDRYFTLRAVIVGGVIITVLGTLRPQLYADWILSALALK